MIAAMLSLPAQAVAAWPTLVAVAKALGFVAVSLAAARFLQV